MNETTPQARASLDFGDWVIMMRQTEIEKIGAYACTTRSITVTAEPFYLEDQSDPDENRYVWAYHITITNEGSQTVRLVDRYWKITDAVGHIHEVRGDGVVGEQPLLGPGESFEYTSGTPLSTPSGFMVGTYGMKTMDGERFEIDVPAFSLDSPEESHLIH